MKQIGLYLLLMLSPGLSAQVKVADLKCELLKNPLGIDVKQPRLSWQIKSEERNVTQSAYQVIVSSTKERLERNDGDVWNSGKINSSQSIHVTYAGNELKTKSGYYWKVKVFTNKGESSWSESAHWSMGPVNKSDWQAKWIGYDKASPWDSVTQWSRLSARYLRKVFQQSGAIKRATVYMCGLGLYELFINGHRIGDQVLAPAPTDYRKSVLYNTYDVTNDLKSGDNAIGVTLGNGRFFTMRQNYKTQKHNTFGFPKLMFLLEIEYSDGKKKIVSSDETWKLNVDGPIRTNNEYDGEEYDATKEFGDWTNALFNDKSWKNAELVQSPRGKLTAQMQQPLKVMGRIVPVSVKQVNGKHVLDMGQNFSGWLQIKVKGSKGQKIKLRFAESLQPNGELYVANLRDAKVTDVYTLKGVGEEIWHPSFVYHGFRYVEISDWPGTPQANDFEGQVIYDALETAGSFATANSTINAIVKNAWWGIASNYKGMPVDCPQRNERQPWLGDRAQGAYGESFLFNNATLYAKWLNDIEQSQTEEGAIPDVAPAFWNYYSDNVTWPGTYILVAEMLYKQFGDVNSIIKHYPSMKKWMDYMKKKYMKDFILTKDKYGDWCVPPEGLHIIRSRDSTRTTNGELIATATYYHLLDIMKKFAVMSNKPADVDYYDGLMKNVRAAFNNKFFNPAKNCYDNNTVTANLLPLYFGMVNENQKEAVFKNINDRIGRDNVHISTGVIGTQWLMRGLTDQGYASLSHALATNKTYPSWGYMVEQGATTIWELWNGNTADPQMNSQNHVMLLGDLLIWLYEYVAGIKSDDKEVAFKKIVMKPRLTNEMVWVKASYKSLYGNIISAWTKRSTGELEWDVTVPANTTAELHIPAVSVNNILEGGKELQKSEGIHSVNWESGEAIVTIGSGEYKFTTKTR